MNNTFKRVNKGKLEKFPKQDLPSRHLGEADYSKIQSIGCPIVLTPIFHLKIAKMKCDIDLNEKCSLPITTNKGKASRRMKLSFVFRKFLQLLERADQAVYQNE